MRAANEARLARRNNTFMTEQAAAATAGLARADAAEDLRRRRRDDTPQRPGAETPPLGQDRIPAEKVAR